MITTVMVKICFYFFNKLYFMFIDLDIDECSTPNICPLNSVCKNTIGSYQCICNSGLMMSQVKIFFNIIF